MTDGLTKPCAALKDQIDPIDLSFDSDKFPSSQNPISPSLKVNFEEALLIMKTEGHKNLNLYSTTTFTKCKAIFYYHFNQF